MRSEAEQRRISLNQKHPMLNWSIIGTDTVSFRREFERATSQEEKPGSIAPLIYANEMTRLARWRVDDRKRFKSRSEGHL